MSTESREEILANFQTVTGIDDFEKAIKLLDKNDWDFSKAVSEASPSNTLVNPPRSMPKRDAKLNKSYNYFGQINVKIPENSDASVGANSSNHSRFSPSPPSPSSPQNGASKQVTNKRRHDGLPVSYNSDSIEASTSNSSNQVKLLIEYDGETIVMEVPLNITVAKLKHMIYECTSISVSCQLLSGWVKEPLSDDSKLEEGLVKLGTNDSTFYLILHKIENCDRSIKKQYSLKIYDVLKERNYSLQMPGSHKVIQVKKNVAKLSGVPVGKQLWEGWPSDISDDTLLANAGLNDPKHILSFKVKNDMEIIDLVSSSSSHEDFEDSPEVFGADDEQVFSSDNTQVSLRPLVPPDVEDEIAGSVHFIDTFIFRYGTNCPQFFSGTLQDALREACLRPMSERHLLAIYLHHDESVLSNIFCSEVLCFESIVETLSANFVLWGWDVTSDAARSMFYNSINELVGPSVADTVGKFSVENYPLMIILTRPRRNVDLYNIITGNHTVTELLSLLIHAVEVFSQIQNTEVRNEEERCLRENIKDEQDRAYEESLLADRAKDEAKRQQESLLREETERLKRQKQEEEEKREAERVAVEAELPQEPSDGSLDSVIKARIRTPSGEIIQRKFLATDCLKILFNYLLVQGFRISEYKVISGWPRKDLTILDPEISMKDLKLANQETFILEER